MIESIAIPTEPKGYSFINGKLESAVFERALLEVNGTETVLSYGLVLPNGSTTIVPFKNFFSSAEDFQKGELAPKFSMCINYHKAGVRPIEPNNTIVFFSLGENGVEKTTATKYMVVYISKTNETSVIGNNFPTKKYPSQRDLFENESFIVCEDGKEHTHICVKELLTLNATQDKAVNELEKAIANCLDLGIELVADCSNIVAINTLNLKSFCIDYDGNCDYDEYTDEYFKFGRSIHNRIAIVDCDEKLFFERKDEEQ